MAVKPFSFCAAIHVFLHRDETSGILLGQRFSAFEILTASTVRWNIHSSPFTDTDRYFVELQAAKTIYVFENGAHPIN